MTRATDTNSRWQRFLCRMNIHKMPKWGDPVMGQKSNIYDNTPQPVMIQQRFCEACSARELRLAR